MKQSPRILVATDLSNNADDALREAARIASATDGTLGVVHVVHEHEEPRQHELLVRARVTQAIGRQRIDVFIEQGVDHTAIVRRAAEWEADVLVIGARSANLLGQLFRGVSDRIVRDARCPVLVVRRAHGHGGVIAATDLMKPTLPAVIAGAEEAERRGTYLRVVHAVGFWTAEGRYLLGASAASASSSEYAAFADELETAVASVGLDPSCRVLTGSAAQAIVREAEATDAELIVVAKSPEQHLRAKVSRGIVDDVVANAPCSVLVVRAPPELPAPAWP